MSAVAALYWMLLFQKVFYTQLSNVHDTATLSKYHTYTNLYLYTT